MMLPGAVSLGAYEGGALAAILAAVQAAEGELAVDAIASASAGSITAVVASRALLRGADPFKLMVATWVDLPSLDHLETHDPISPLSMEQLQESAQSLLRSDTVPDGGNGVYRQDVDIQLSMALTSLGGLAYRLPTLRDTDEGRKALTLLAKTNLDWKSASFTAEGPADQFLTAVDGALASGSTPVGFPPKLLDRSSEKDDYVRRGFVNPKDDWHFWYSDGGDIDNEPFGRLLDLIEETPNDGDDQRVIVLLQTEPPDAGRDLKWFDPDPANTPTWTSTLMRVNHIQKGQNYYDDLRRLEKTNSRLAWLDVVAGKIDGLLDELAGLLDGDVKTKAEDRIQAVLAEAAAAISADQNALRRASLGDGAAVPAADGGAAGGAATAGEADTVLSVLQRATGLHGKQRVVVEIISPDIDGGDVPASDKLAGEFLFHFGGFLDQRFRRSDFDLGARNAMTWLASWLPDRVSHPDAVLAAVRAGFDARGWSDIAMGDASIGKLTLREDAQLARLIIHLLHVVEYGLRHDLRKR
jgi:hypothetical protein